MILSSVGHMKGSELKEWWNHPVLFHDARITFNVFVFRSCNLYPVMRLCYDGGWVTNAAILFSQPCAIHFNLATLVFHWLSLQSFADNISGYHLRKLQKTLYVICFVYIHICSQECVLFWLHATFQNKLQWE